MRPSYWFDPWYGSRFDTSYVHQTLYAQTVIPPAAETVVVPSAGPAPVAPPVTFGAPSQTPNADAETDNPRALAWLEEGESALHAGRLDEAERAFLRASLAEPDNGFAVLLYGVVMFLHGDVNSSATAIRHALDATPELVTDPVDLRQLVADQTLLFARIDDLAARNAAAPANEDVALLLGYIKYATGSASEAAGIFSELATAGELGPLCTALAESAREHAGQ